MIDYQHLTRGGNGSHWHGCEESHWDCRIAKLKQENEILSKELELYHRCGSINEVERVMSALPITADGVKVVPGMTVWFSCRDRWHTTKVIGMSDSEVDLYMEPFSMRGSRHTTLLYSTREAAQQKGTDDE